MGPDSHAAVGAGGVICARVFTWSSGGGGGGLSKEPSLEILPVQAGGAQLQMTGGVRQRKGAYQPLLAFLGHQTHTDRHAGRPPADIHR